MEFDFNIYECDYDKKDGILITESTGIVKCKKAFPIYTHNGKEYLFKPLSKTKPYTTPLFGLSEAFWSTVIRQYFDEKAPLYRLAICKGYTDHHPSRYSKGTIVESIVGKDEELVNLLELSLAHSDETFDIKDYINYCGMYYDYTAILNSKFFSENREFGEALARQVLISILKNDLNFHYENIALVRKGNSYDRVAEPIDHEFSLPFLFPDDPFLYFVYYSSYNIALQFNAADNDLIDPSLNAIAILNNIRLIATKYPEIALDFLKRLRRFIHDFKKTDLVIPVDYLEPLSSHLYQVYEAIYKEHEGSKQLHEIPKFELVSLDIAKLTWCLKRDILVSARDFYDNLRMSLDGGRVITKK